MSDTKKATKSRPSARLARKLLEDLEERMGERSGRLRPPFTWMGGKGPLADKIVPLIPPSHDTFVDVFGGAGNILMAKRRSTREVYNDLHTGTTTLYRVLRDERLYLQLMKRIQRIDYSKQTWTAWCEKKDPKSKRPHDVRYWEDADAVERAARFLYVAHTSRTGNVCSSWAAADAAYYTTNKAGWERKQTDGLDEHHERLRYVTILNESFEQVIARYNSPRTFLYLDPPYAKEARKSDADVYTHESSDKLHVTLVDLLLQLKGKAILSGYPTLTYKPLMDAGWKQFRLPYITFSMGRTSKDRFIDKTPAERLKARKAMFTWEYIWVSPTLASFAIRLAPSYGWQESEVYQAARPRKAARTKRMLDSSPDDKVV